MHWMMAMMLSAIPAQGVEDVAQESAESWLGLIDEGRYGESWDEAAALVKEMVKKGEWEKSIEGARRPFGKFVSRTMKSRTYTKSLPNAPTGEYVVIQFDTTFENKKAVETITPMKSSDGTWRISGYYIR